MRLTLLLSKMNSSKAIVAMALLLANGKCKLTLIAFSCGPAIQLPGRLDLGTNPYPQRRIVFKPSCSVGIHLDPNSAGDYHWLRSVHDDEYGR